MACEALRQHLFAAADSRAKLKSQIKCLQNGAGAAYDIWHTQRLQQQQQQQQAIHSSTTVDTDDKDATDSLVVPPDYFRLALLQTAAERLAELLA